MGPVGFFDSGLGGLSVLREALGALPKESFVFFGDNANAPYGEKTEAEIRRLTWRGVETLLDQGVKALVLACNTATSATAESLRARLGIPVLGMEPALKPAALVRHGGIILVLATRLTLSLPKFERLMERFGEGAVPLPAPGLVGFVEQGILSGAAVEAYLAELLGPYLGRQIDAVVLGCTHFVFLKAAVAAFFPPETAILDGNGGTVRQLRRVLEQRGLLRQEGEGGVRLMTSGVPERILPLMERLLYGGDGPSEGGQPFPESTS